MITIQTIIMTRKLIAALACATLLVGTVSAQSWTPAGDRIKTKWAEEVSPTNALPEYPRPQMVRDAWKNLNGLWNYAITDKAAVKPASADGQILVPYCIESALSGVGKHLTADQSLWYETTFSLPREWKGKKVKLNFDAVDWKAEVFVNDILVGSHTGGYTAFSFDITPYLAASGKQNLSVKVTDATNNALQPRGKQVENPNGIWYTPVSGIWQTVWLEAVAEASITDYYTVSDIKSKTLDVTVSTEGAKLGDYVLVELLDGAVGYSAENPSSTVLSSAKAAPGQTLTIGVPDMKLWSPASPYLYGLRMSIVRGGKTIDKVQSYTSMRKISVITDKDGYKRMALNDKPLFQYGPLDQGWWPDGLYTPPTYEALRYDVEKTRDLGFNMIRKHIKVEPSRWFTDCDQLGILVWQDMPSFDDNHRNRWGVNEYNEGLDYPASPEAKANFYKEWTEIINQVKKFQCVVVWVPFNEAWSQFDTKAVVEYTQSLDRTRLVNMSSGGNWEPGVGDILDNHHYPNPYLRLRDLTMVNVLGEYGGIGLPVDGHLWQPDKNWDYSRGKYKNFKEVTDAYVQYAEELAEIVKQGCSAAVYTQTTDVEIEVNGFMTYDRKVVKMEEDRIKAANTKVIESMK
jgi:Beta-galactosidase/beta-glucuronidase